MINTKDIPTGGGKAPKTLQPGNINITINKIYLDEYKWEENAYNVMLDCEGPDLGSDFEGFFIDQSNEKAGRYKGQVGRVRASQWPFKDKLLPGGIQISRDVEIAKFLKNIAVATDCVKWYEGQNGKHETIESLVAKMNADAPFKGKVISACLAGKEYQNKAGYTNHDLFFPKFSKTGIPFESVTTDSGRVYSFNEEDFILRKKESKEVEEFAASADDADFSLD